MSMSMGSMSILLGFFLDIQNGAALVLSALGAGAMGQLLLVAVGALGEPDGGQKVVGSGGVAVRRVEWRLFGFGMMQIPFDSCPLQLCLTGAPSESAP